jgi:hypothetical protein
MFNIVRRRKKPDFRDIYFQWIKILVVELVICCAIEYVYQRILYFH